MFLDVLPFKNDTARLVRVYGDEPCITLPEALPAPEGGTLTITELGDYCFSEKPRGLPAPEELCRYAVEPDGTARLLRAFGRDLTGASHARYDLDFGDGDASTAARSGEEALHPLCGSFLEELVLPGSLRVIGRPRGASLKQKLSFGKVRGQWRFMPRNSKKVENSLHICVDFR